jgi:micrococcal nuclease
MSVARLGLVSLAAIAGCHNTDGRGAPADASNTTCGAGTATVERVIDGDTIVLAGDIRVRYLLVDAPETTLGHDDCYGTNASQFNRDLVLGKTIALRYDAQCLDSYGRTLAYVSVDGHDVNRLLVERGYACVLHIPPDGNDRADEFKAVQAEARSAKRGLWGACDPIPCN